VPVNPLADFLQHLPADPPDLILLDVDLPRMSGWQVLKKIRQRVDWHEIPVLMVTALLEPSTAEQERYPRYDCYVTKKKTGQDLLLLVGQALEGSLETTDQQAPTV